MKAYKIELLVLGFENISLDDIKCEIENMRHVSAAVMETSEVDIGEWRDDHPLNRFSTRKDEFKRLFPDS